MTTVLRKNDKCEWVEVSPKEQNVPQAKASEPVFNFNELAFYEGWRSPSPMNIRNIDEDPSDRFTNANVGM